MRNGNMKRVTISALIVALLFSVPVGSVTTSAGGTQTRIAPKSSYPHAPGRVIIEFKDAPQESFWRTYENQFGLTLERELGKHHSLEEDAGLNSISSDQGRAIYTATISHEDYLDAALLELNNDPRVEVADPDYIYEPQGMPQQEVKPNDLYFNQMFHGFLDGQWGLKAAHFPTAWSYGTNGAEIAVLDGAADPSHPDLNVVESRDFSGGQGNALGKHGTQVASIAAARSNNVIGIAGAAWGAPVRSYNISMADGKISLSAAIDALKALPATMPNGGVINCSWGGDGDSQILRATIIDLETKGFITVAAAGNGTENDSNGRDVDAKPFYPASYSEVIGVAATANHSGERASFSNFGKRMIAAPGNGVLGAIPGGDYETTNGTSTASPIVAGAAALLKSQGYSIPEVKRRIYGTLDNPPLLRDCMGLLNVERAVRGDFNPAPPLTATFQEQSPKVAETRAITLHLNVSDPIATTAWSFGDGTTQNGGTSATHTYQRIGQYTVTVSVSNFFNQIMVSTQVIVTDLVTLRIKKKGGGGKLVLTATSSQQRQSLPPVLTIVETGTTLPFNPGADVYKLKIKTSGLPPLLTVRSSLGGEVAQAWR